MDDQLDFIVFLEITDVNMKTIIISILDPDLRRVLGEDIKVDINDDDDFLDAVAKLDESYMKMPIKAKRGDTVFKSILRFIWDAENNQIYDDVGIEARDQDNNWIPVKNDPFVTLPGNTTVLISPEAGC
ncbi:MAG: hypothetical protein ACTSVI_13225 [Promethearchaeota archaeon]